MKTKSTSKHSFSKSSTPSKIVRSKKLSSSEKENKLLRKRITELEKELPVVRNNAEPEQVKETIAASEEKFRVLVENMPIGIYYNNLKGDFLYGNRAAEEIIGYKKEELIGKNFLKLNLLSLKDIPLAIKLLALNVSGKATGPDQFELNRKDGKKVFVEIHTQIITLGSQKIVLGMVKNVTERKLAEDASRESEKKYLQLFKLVPIPLGISNKDGDIIYFNDWFTKIFGYTTNDVPTLKKWWQRAYPDKSYRRSVQDSWNAAVAKAAKEGLNIEPAEYRVTCKSGEERIVMIGGISFEDNFLVTFIDITERKLAEDKTRQLSLAVEQSPVTIVITDPLGNIQYVNPKFFETTGYYVDEAIGKKPSILKSGFTTPEEYKQLWDTITSGNEWKGVFQNKRKDGDLYWESATIAPILNEKGEITNFLGIKIDITERRRAEVKLQEQARLLGLIFEHSLDCVVLLDKDYNFISVSETYAKACNRTVAEFKGRNHFEMFPSSLKDEFDDAIRRRVTYNKRSRPFTFPDHPEWGVTYWDMGMVPIRGVDDRIELILFTLKDVTEHKQAEKVMQASEDRYRVLAEASPDMIYVIDRDDRVQYVNTFAARLFSTTPEKLIGKLRADLFPPDIAEKQGHTLRHVLQSGEPKFNESSLRLGDKKMWVNSHFVPLRDESGAVTAVMGISRNITDRKRTEEELEESREKYRGLSEAAFEAIFISEKGICIEQNQMAEKMFGYTSEEAIGRYGTEWIVPEDREMVMKNMLTGFEEPYEATALRKDGTTFPCMLRGKMMHYKGRNVRVTSLSDITEHKRIEERLADERTLMRTIVDLLPDAVFVKDLSGRKIFANKHELELLNVVSESEIFGKTDFDIYPEKDAKLYEEDDRSILQSGIPKMNVEVPFVSRTGESYWLQNSKVPLRDAKGNIVGLVCVNHDMTERKRSEEALLQAELKYRVLFTSANDSIFLMIGDTFVECNPKTEQMFGCSRMDLLNRKPYEFSPPYQSDNRDSKESVLERITAALSGEPQLFEWIHKRLDGTLFNAEVNLNRVEIDKQVMVLAIVRDITERKRTEKELRENETRYRAIVENIRQAYYETDSRSLFTYCNPELIMISGYEEQELIGMSSLRLVAEEHYGTVAEKYNQWKKEKRTDMSLEFLVQKKNGEKFWVEQISHYEFDEQGRLIKASNVVKDIQERKFAEEALQKSEIFFRSVWEHSTSGMRVTDENGIVLSVNKAFCTIVGKTEREMVGSSFSVIYTEEVKSHSIEKHKERFLAKTVPAFMEKEVMLWNGKKVWFEVLNSFIEFGEANRMLLGIFTDITERKRTQESMEMLMKRYQSLLHTASDGIHILDDKGNVVEANTAFCTMLGYSRDELLHLNVAAWDLQWSGQELLNKINEFIAHPTVFETRHRCKDGTIRNVEINAVGVTIENNKYLYASARDITERKKSEQIIRDLQRRESIGVLAGGIAHDFNNLLTAMMGNVSLAKLRIPDDHPAVLNLDKTQAAMERAATLTRQMLAYSGTGRFQNIGVDIVKVVQEHINLFEALLPKNVAIVTHLSPTPVIVEGDPGQIEQVVMNLIINGGEAIGDKQGVVNIDVSTVILSDEELLPYGKLNNQVLQKGTYSLFQVSDNGAGMNDDTVIKIFDPFFTTKFVGRGLGLSAVLGIIRGHRGGITVKSTQGVGTIFRVILPLMTSGIHALQEKNQTTETIGHPPTVLVIDDEQYILDMLSEIFDERKYQRFLTSDPEKGIAIYNTHWQTIDVVVIDYSMPKMNGTEVLIALRKINPNVKVIMSSGYSEEQLIHVMGDVQPTAIIQKPSHPDDLVSLINKVLRGV